MVEKISDFQRFTLGGIDPNSVEAIGLVDLISQDLLPSTLPYESRVKAAQVNYCLGDHWLFRDEEGTFTERQIFLALSEGKTVGLLAFLELGKDSLDGISKETWDDIRKYSPDFFRKANSSPILMSNGLVVDRELRRQGLYRQLMSKAIDDLNPAVILSASRSPVSVAARATITGEKGYRTFLGFDEVTPGFPLDSVPKGLLWNFKNLYQWINWNGLVHENKHDRTYELTHVQFNPTIGEKDIPDVSGASMEIRKAFRSIVAEQKRVNRLGQEKSIYKMLVSIRGDLL